MLELFRGGRTASEVQEETGVSRATATRWERGARVANVADSEPDRSSPSHTEPSTPLPTDLVAALRQIITEQHAAIQLERQAGNTRGAASGAATLERLVRTLKQVEAVRDKEADVLELPRAEIEGIKASLTERIKAICSVQPLHCADCGRELTVSWGPSGAAG